MANETVVVLGNLKVLESNGGSITNTSVVIASVGTYGIVADGANFPDAKFVLGATFGTAPTEGTSLCLYARPLNIKSTNDSEVPEAARPTYYVGRFIVNNVTTTQYMELIAEDVPWEAEYYIHNNGTGQTVSAGWTLDVIPCTKKPA